MKQHLLKFAASLHKIIALFKIYVFINKEWEWGSQTVLETTEEQTPVKWICPFLCIIINIQDYICNMYTKEKKKQEKQLWTSRKVLTGQYSYRCSKTIAGL